MTRTAKLFMNGRSQALRLPADFRFEGSEVYIQKDSATGNLIVSKKPHNWDAVKSALENLVVPEDFLNAKERDLGEFPSRDPFEGWSE